MNRLRMEGRTSITSAEAKIVKIDRELETPLNLILKGGAADAINAKIVLLEQRKKDMADRGGRRAAHAGRGHYTDAGGR